MSMYGREDYEDIRYELDKFLEDHNIYELLKLVTDAVEQYEWEEHTVLCKDCKHYKQSAITDRKMCFRKDVDGVEVCYDFLPYDGCTYGERKDESEA